jgi:DNA modification methylase
MILTGDCREVMAGMDAASVDAIVTDPPYGLEFMGKEWDTFPLRLRTNEADPSGRKTGDGKTTNAVGFANGVKHVTAGPAAQAWHETWAREAFRVLKPGGHLLAFSGTRTSHRMVSAIEDAGFEIRDSIMWVFGSGFPKSLDVSKAIDKAAGAEREVVKGGGRSNIGTGAKSNGRSNFSQVLVDPTNERTVKNDTSLPATPEAERWAGWGTALKPAHEPICVARKPLVGTVARNVLEYGTGALNIDGCRIGVSDDEPNRRDNPGRILSTNVVYGKESRSERSPTLQHTQGRWPSNVILSESAAAVLDEMSGERTSVRTIRKKAGLSVGNGVTLNRYQMNQDNEGGYEDSVGCSRFFLTVPDLPIDGEDVTRFRYQAKVSRAERQAGLDGESNPHPTLKPIALMKWLITLVTPPGGTVLDPFAGSGSTGCAASVLGVDFIGIEQDAEYAAIAERRIAYWAEQSTPKPLPQLPLFAEQAAD